MAGKEIDQGSSRLLFALGVNILSFLACGSGAEETENLSGLAKIPGKDIFAVRENETTCLMVEFAARFHIPYDTWASNYVDLVTEQASVSMPGNAQVKGRCARGATAQPEIIISWSDDSYILKLYFDKETRNVTKRRQQHFWKVSKIKFTYDTSDSAHFKDAVNVGKFTAISNPHMALFLTPMGHSYSCLTTETISLSAHDRQKVVVFKISEAKMQPYEIAGDFLYGPESQCTVDQRESLEETLPLALGLALGLIIVVIIGVYHLQHRLSGSAQPQQDRANYKEM
ncbi:lysosome-associated membrane glycoprotein 5 [Lampetra fluviatilis]